MHAARAVHKQRVRREEKEKVEVRRPSAISQISRIPRSPAVSITNSSLIRRRIKQDEENKNLNFSYVGFIIAVFGAVPLIVGTFVEVPALWEIGLGLTLVGLFIGIVFWCTELCAEAKRFSQKKNQLSSRGRIEDSNLLQVPDRKFGNGLDSRRGSFQSDSVSLIAPMAHHTPKHLQRLHPHLSTNNVQTGDRLSLSQYSSSDISKSDESSGTLYSQRANGHLAGGPMVSHPPPKLLLRGTGRKDDGRVVSLVQPDPGLDDDSDSDAETVIEAPTGKPKIIQVQSCQEKGMQSPSASNLLTPTTPTNPTSPTFSVENETVPPLNPLAAHHRTIRMPVMPQDVDKLKRCECGRYLLTERDKIVGIRVPGLHGGGSSMPATAYNSPSLTGMSSSGTAPATRKVFPKGQGATSSLSAGALSTMQDSNGSSENDVSSQGTTPISTEHKIISVNPNDEFEGDSGGKKERNKSAKAKTPPPPPLESVVQVEPSLNSSDLLKRSEKTEGKEDNSAKQDLKKDDDIDDNELHELLTEITAQVEDGKETLNKPGEGAHVSPQENSNDDEEFEDSIAKPKARPDESSAQVGEQPEAGNGGGNGPDNGKNQKLEQVHQPASVPQHPARPTFLPLPVNHSVMMMTDNKNESSSEVSTIIDENCGPVTVMMSSASSASTVVFLGGEVASISNEQIQQNRNRNEDSINSEEVPVPDPNCEPEEEFTKLRDGDDDEDDEHCHGPKLKSREESLEELLDQIERKQDSEVLAVVVQ